MRAAADLVLKDVAEDAVDYVFIARRALYSAEWNSILQTFKSAVTYLNVHMKHLKRSE